MNKTEILMYLLKSMILSGIFFGYYTLFLKNTIYHAYNRFYLLASMALSLAIPFFNRGTSRRSKTGINLFDSTSLVTGTGRKYRMGNHSHGHH
jgi:hypothetical protein